MEAIIMRNSVLFWTAFTSSLFIVLCLKFFRVFKFVKWNPLGWSKKYQLFAESPGIIKWALLFLFILVVIIILYFISIATKELRPDIVSFMIGLVIVLLIEWMIQTPNDMKKYLK